jgi:hypothetical protein
MQWRQEEEAAEGEAAEEELRDSPSACLTSVLRGGKFDEVAALPVVRLDTQQGQEDDTPRPSTDRNMDTPMNTVQHIVTVLKTSQKEDK